MKRWLVIIPFVIALACGITLATWVTGGGDKPLPEHPGQRGFLNVTTVISGTTYVCTSPCVTETLATNAQQIDTAKAVAWIDRAIAELRLTTISGKKYCVEMAGGPCGGTGYAYRGSRWYVALGSLTLAQYVSPAPIKPTYDLAGGNLLATTTTGVAYFANPAKYAGGHWDVALRALSEARAYLVANPAKSGPSIYTLTK